MHAFLQHNIYKIIYKILNSYENLNFCYGILKAETENSVRPFHSIEAQICMNKLEFFMTKFN